MNFRRTLPADDEGIPMSSMADIVFLLIIFFMLTTVFSVKRGIEIELPHTEVSESVSLKNIVIRIDSEGALYLDGQKARLKEIGPYVISKRSANSEKGVVLESDGSVEYQNVMDVLDELLLAGVTDISLPTREEEPDTAEE